MDNSTVTILDDQVATGMEWAEVVATVVEAIEVDTEATWPAMSQMAAAHHAMLGISPVLLVSNLPEEVSVAIES